MRVSGKPHNAADELAEDLAMAPPLVVFCRERRYRCPQPRCPRRALTEASEQISARRRLTLRLRNATSVPCSLAP